MKMSKILVGFGFVVFLSFPVSIFADETSSVPDKHSDAEKANIVQEEEAKKKFLSLEALLEKVKQGRVYDGQVGAQRIREFKARVHEQEQKLQALKEEKNQAELLSRQLEENFASNDETLADLEGRLEERLGSIKELFGVLQQVSSDAHAQLSNSLTTLHYPDRGEYLLAFSNKMGQTKILPKITEIERLWFEMQQEMTASGDVKTFESLVVDAEGQSSTKQITRVGLFNIVSDGKYLQFIPETQRVLEYMRQPRARFTRGAEDMAEASSGDRVAFSVDPTRGQLLSLLVRSPSLSERIAQGGVIGYIIIGVGIFSVLLAVQRLAALFLVGIKINRQIQHPDTPSDNPLGRILSSYINNKHADQETVELKMGEAIIQEVPKINRNLSLLKIIAAIAPLMGLLGTVTGMIITFQAITLFGAGDPKLMANGISQALVTTVLGLVVAIPTLLLHNLVQSRAKKITEILEKESIGLVAEHAENQRLA